MMILAHKSSAQESWQTTFRNRVNDIWRGPTLGLGAFYTDALGQIMEVHSENGSAVVFSADHLRETAEHENADGLLIQVLTEIPYDWEVVESFDEEE